MAGHRTIVGGVVAAAAWAALAGPAAKANTVVNERVVLDGCEVGGGGNDIHSVQSHYEPERDRIVVTLRLCGPARPKATYRVYLDHTAPFVGRTKVSGNCASTADSVVARSPGGHQGVGTSEVQGDLVRFVVPLARLHVGKPKDVPLIPLWVTSTLGKVEDRAPNRETGDGCEHPRAATETLVQARVEIVGGIAFISSLFHTGAIDSRGARAAIETADVLCQGDALSAGFFHAASIHAWLSNAASHPASHIVHPFFGPIQTADGTTVAESISDFASRGLQAPIDKDIHGDDPLGHDNFIWTATLPNGNQAGDSSTNCRDWTSNSASDIGGGGNMTKTDAGFTTGFQDSCDQSHHVMCVQFDR